MSATKVTALESSILVEPLLGENRELFHLGNQQFREKDNAHASAIFIDHPVYSKVLEIDGEYLTSVNSVSSWGFSIGFLSLLLVLALTLFTGLIWTINLLRKKYDNKALVFTRLFPSLAVFSLVLAIVALFNFNYIGLSLWS